MSIVLWSLLRSRKGAANEKKRARRRAFGRLAAYIVTVGAVGVTLLGRSARADIGSSSIAFGREIAELGTAADSHGGTHVKLNGQDVFMSNELLDANTNVADVLDRYEEHCRKDPGALGELWSQIAKASEPPPTKSLTDQVASANPLDFGVFRSEAKSEGIVMCFVKGSETPSTLTESVRLLKETHDLGAIGKLRYAYTSKLPSGQVRVLSVWTEDKFNLDAFKVGGGAATGGTDVTTIPVPPDSNRAFTAEIVGTPFGVWAYTSTKSPVEVSDFYDAKLVRDGWSGINPPDDQGGQIRMYFRGGEQAMVAARIDPKGNRTIVDIGVATATSGASAKVEPGSPIVSTPE